MLTYLTVGKLHPITLQRRYDSSSTYASPLGNGWGLNYDKRLYVYPDWSVVLREGSGWKRHFTRGIYSDYVSPPGETGTLNQNYTDGTFTLTHKNGDQENYDTLGRLVSIVDTRGNSLVISYTGATRTALTGLLPESVGATPRVISYDYRIAKIEEKGADGVLTGYWVSFDYDATSGILTTLTDSTGRTVTYGHSDGYGNLTSVSGPGVDATYTYGDSYSVHHMVGHNHGRGTWTNQYDSSGRVWQQTYDNGTVLFEYLLPKQKTRVTTTIKDADGTVLNTRTRTVEFDTNGQIVKDTDTYGNVKNYTRSDFRNATWITYQDYWENTGTVTSSSLVLRNAVSYSYDDHGNVLTKTEAVGDPLERTSTYTYHPIFNKVATETVNECRRSCEEPGHYLYLQEFGQSGVRESRRAAQDNPDFLLHYDLRL